MSFVIGMLGLFGGLIISGFLDKKTNIRKYFPFPYFILTLFIMGALTYIFGWIFGVDMDTY